jgi:hypothetical protein
MGHQLKTERIYATLIAAEMVWLESGRDRPDDLLIKDAMHSAGPAGK